MIQFFGVSKVYPGGQIGLDGVDLEIESGEFVFLTGPSGAGKSTLLKLIYREIGPTSGSILVNGRNVGSIPRKKIPYLRRSIGVVFQNSRLIQRKTVLENVGYLPRILGMPAPEQRRVALEALERVGLADRADAFPRELSGGESQRVAIARAVVNDPTILLADEPTGNLDPKLSHDILRLFVETNLRGTTVLFATHDPEILRMLGGRMLELQGGRLAVDRPAGGGGHR